MGPWLRRAVACVVLFGAAGMSTRTQSEDSLSSYRQLVEGYRKLDADTMRRLAAISAEALAPAIDSVVAASGWPPDDLKAAAMLHTDTGIELMKAGHVEPGVSHLNIAARLIDRTLGASPHHASFGRRWYVLSTAMLQAHGAPVWAEEFGKRLKARLPESPAAPLLAEARTAEILAGEERPWRRIGYVGMIGGLDARVARRYALVAQLFEKVVQVDAASHEAWLHLGRTRMLSGDDRGAIEALERAAAAQDPRHRYLATLFLGAIDERHERFDAAESRYRAALSQYPRGQSAALALSHLLSRTAREADARAVLDEHHRRNGAILVDPLWTYLLGVEQQLGATLNELRAEVWQ